ncbi:MAG: hypothetical protein NZT92_03260 [Abditibacteriales bacterium]|nr:hypothetical protein [Abditibacteriales bacterium]MDW8364919.1 hypothetical protein [Abditibacteriales bacterium]
MTEQELYKLVASLVREELARRVRGETPADSPKPTLLAVFT